TDTTYGYLINCSGRRNPTSDSTTPPRIVIRVHPHVNENPFSACLCVLSILARQLQLSSSLITTRRPPRASCSSAEVGAHTARGPRAALFDRSYHGQPGYAISVAEYQAGFYG